jgi:toluene monooxygenase system ferredoxin subunit
LGLHEDELWFGEMRGVVVGSQRLLVVRTEAGVCVYRDRCPHLGFPLSEGKLEAGVITCAAHRHRFDAATGAGINPKSACLSKLSARVEQGRVVADLPQGSAS